MNMIDKVARALFVGMYPGHAWESAPAEVQRTMRLHAKSALTAMREPTPAVSAAINAAIQDGGLSTEICKATVDAALAAG